ncbi:MAG: ABC transporter permease [Pseudomonadota bacterium]
MVFHLAKNELLKSMNSKKQLYLFSIIFVLFILFTVLANLNLLEKTSSYNEVYDSRENNIANFSHANRTRGYLSALIKKPRLINSYFTGFSIQALTTDIFNKSEKQIFKSIDFSFLFAIVFSLLALILSHDTITSEKQNGALKHVTSYNVSRPKYLLGIFLGGFLYLFVFFSISYFFSIFISVVFFQALINEQDFYVFLLIYGISVIYLGIVFLMGMSISTFCKTNKSSIIISCFAWIFLVIIIPNTAPQIAERAIKLPPAAKLYSEAYKIKETDRDRLINEQLTRLRKKMQIPDFNAENFINERKNFLLNKNNQARYYEFRKQAEDLVYKINNKQKAKVIKLEDAFMNKLKKQENLTASISSLSLYFNFLNSLYELSNVGLKTGYYEIEKHDRHAKKIGVYMKEKEFSALGENLLYDHNMPIDLSDYPRLKNYESSISFRLEAIKLNLFIMFVYIVVFSLICFIKFKNYDVR